MSLTSHPRDFLDFIRSAKKLGFYPYFRPISQSFGPEMELDGRRSVMLASNLITHHSSFITHLCTKLLKRLPAFVGKKKAIVHTTGFGENLGSLGCLPASGNFVVCMGTFSKAPASIKRSSR